MRPAIERAFGATMLGYVLIVTAAVIVRDWRRERARIADVIATTRADLEERREAVMSKRDAMIAGEGLETATDA